MSQVSIATFPIVVQGWLDLAMLAFTFVEQPNVKNYLLRNESIYFILFYFIYFYFI
jgi:hypothetical protein